MSRPQPLDDIQPYTLMPPAPGLYSPYRKFSSIRANGRLLQCRNIRIWGESLSSIEGNTHMSGQTNEAQADSNLHNKCVFVWKSNTVHDLVYVNGKDLRYFAIGTPLSDALVKANIIPSDTAVRMPVLVWNVLRFIGTDANGLWLYSPTTHSGFKTGVPAPSSAPTLADGGAGALTAGTYQGRVSFVNSDSHESNLSAFGSVTLAANKQIAWSAIPTGAAGDYIAIGSRKLYRSTVGATTPLFVATIPDNTTTTYTDNNTDASLGSAAATDNDIYAGGGILSLVLHRQRIVILDDNGKIWYSKVDAITGLVNYEAYPAGLTLQLNFGGGVDLATALFSDETDLYCYGGNRVFRISGDIATGIQSDIINAPGMFSTFAAAAITKGVRVYLDSTKRLILHRGDSDYEDIGQDIQGILTAISKSAGLSGPDMVYDAIYDAIYLNYGIAAGANTSTLIFDMKTHRASLADYRYSISYYSPYDRNLIGAQYLSKFVWSWRTAEAETDGPGSINLITYVPIVETQPWTPSPGDDIDFLEALITVEPITAPSDLTMRAAVKVEWALDGSNKWTSSWCSMALRQVTDMPNTRVAVRTIRIPIFKLAKTLSLRCSIPSNNMLTSGMQVSAIQVIARILTPGRESYQNVGEGSRRVAVI